MTVAAGGALSKDVCATRILAALDALPSGQTDLLSSALGWDETEADLLSAALNALKSRSVCSCFRSLMTMHLLVLRLCTLLSSIASHHSLLSLGK